MGRQIEAGEGNRTLVFSLEGCCSTIELHPRGAAEAANLKFEISGFKFTQWGLQDLNLCRHSQRIYSPPPLTTRANPHSISDVVLVFPTNPVRSLLVSLGSESQIYFALNRQKRASGGIRTHDRLITNQLLCQLSYASDDDFSLHRLPSAPAKVNVVSLWKIRKSFPILTPSSASLRPKTQKGLREGQSLAISKSGARRIHADPRFSAAIHYRDPRSQ